MHESQTTQTAAQIDCAFASCATFLWQAAGRNQEGKTGSSPLFGLCSEIMAFNVHDGATIDAQSWFNASTEFGSAAGTLADDS